MGKLLVVSLLLVLLVTACSVDFEDATVTILEIDHDLRTVTFQTGTGLVFTVEVPEDIDLTLYEPGMVILVSDAAALLNGDSPDDPEDPADPEDPEDPEGGNYCSDPEAEHPELSRMAEESGLEYSYLLELFCEQNYGLGELKTAIQYAAELDVDIEYVVAYFELVGNWGGVHQAVAFAVDYGYTMEEALALHEQAGSWAILKMAIKVADEYGVSLDEVLALYADYGNWGAVKKELKALTEEAKPEKDKPEKDKDKDKDK